MWAKGPNGWSISWFPWHEACLGELLLPPGQEASPSHGYPPPLAPAVCCQYPIIHLDEERQSGVKFLVQGNNMAGKAWTPDCQIRILRCYLLGQCTLPLALFMYFLAYLLCINAVNSVHGGVMLQRTCCTCIMQFKGFCCFKCKV